MSEEGVNWTSRQRRRVKRVYVLPNARLSLEKEMDVIKGLVEFSKEGTNPVSYKDIKIGMTNTHISRELTFLKSIQLAGSEIKGKYVPTKECIEFAKLLRWKEEDAKNYLRNILSGTWFVELTQKILRVKQSIEEDELIKELGKESGADPAVDMKSLRRLIEWMKWANILKEEEGKLLLAVEAPQPPLEEAIKVTPSLTLEKEKPKLPLSIQILIQVTPETRKEQIKEIIKAVQEVLEENSETEE